ncbi:MAG: CHRD domain-containing protein, partial [Microvirga sp.]
MTRVWWIVVAGVLAVAVVAPANGSSDAQRPFCKRTTSKTKPYTLRRGETKRLKPADIYPVPRGGCPRTVLTAALGGTVLPVALTGEAETPAGDPVGTGEATIRARKGQGQVCYRLDTSHLSGIAAAHIHRGVAGVAGPVVIPLITPASGSSTGCSPASRAVVAALLKAPAAYYVNVHTAEFPGGAIRGQLAGTATDSFGWIVATNLTGSREPNARGTAVV